MSEQVTASADETEQAGAELARALAPGDLVLVAGEMGAGKTTFVRGACRALGVAGPVSSPTFTIGRRHQGDGVVVSHLDLYRLDGGIAGEEPGFLDDYLTPDAIAFVEWPAIGSGELPEPSATVEIAHGGGDRRAIRIERREPQAIAQ